MNIFSSFCFHLIHRKKKTICATNGAVYYAATPPTPTINNIPIEQFATAVYPPGVPTIYPPTMTPYQPFYQYYSVPMVNHTNNENRT